MEWRTRGKQTIQGEKVGKWSRCPDVKRPISGAWWLLAGSATSAGLRGSLCRHCTRFRILALGYSFLPHTVTNCCYGSKEKFYSSLFHPVHQEWPERWWRTWQTPPMWIHSFVLSAILYHIDLYWIELYHIELKGPAYLTLRPLTLCPLCEPFLSGSSHSQGWGYVGCCWPHSSKHHTYPSNSAHVRFTNYVLSVENDSIVDRRSRCLGRGERIRVSKTTYFEDLLGLLLGLSKYYSCDLLWWKATKQNQQRDRHIGQSLEETRCNLQKVLF